MKQVLRGTGVAIITPFLEDGKVDFVALKNLVNHLIENNVNYIVSLGTTGETPTLTKEEKQEIVKQTSATIAGRIPLVIGAGGNNTAALCEELSEFDFQDAIAILSAAPYYNKPSQEGLYQHYKAVAAASPLPVILYNVPGRTGKNMEVDTVVRLAVDENIIGIKEAAGSIEQSKKLLADLPSDFLIVSGDDDLAAEQSLMGMHGVISVIANCYPSSFSGMVAAGLAGNNEKVKEINESLKPVYQLLFAENNPAGVKAFLAAKGLIKNHLRLPLVSLSKILNTEVEAFVQNNVNLG